MRRLVPGLLMLLLPANALRASLIFQNVVDTGSASPFAAVTNCSVGADATVVFQGTLKSGVSGIYAARNGQISTIADTTQGYASFGTIPAVNGTGDVAFTARLPDGTSGVYRFSNGSITTIADSSSGITPTVASPSINDLGQVAFLAGGKVYVGDGTTVRNYLLSGALPVINNNGLVCSGNSAGVDVSDGTKVTHVLTTQSGTFQGFAAMNNHNVVAITTTSSILTGDGTTTNTIATVPATIDGHLYQYFYDQAAPPINDDGFVVFHPYNKTGALPQDEELALGSQWTRVIGTGDPLFGSTIVTGMGNELTVGLGLQTTRSSFVGDHLAFRYHLASGVEGIALTQVPEPAGLILVTALAGFFPLRPRRRNPSPRRRPATPVRAQKGPGQSA